MKIKLLFTLVTFLSFLIAVQGQTELNSNSNFFSVKDFYYPGQDGNYQRFRVSGFYESITNPGVPSRMFILPRIGFDRNKVRYLNESEELVDEFTPSNRIKVINISLSYSGSLPNSVEATAIGGQVGGTSINIFNPPPLSDQIGNPVIHPYALGFPAVMGQILNDVNAYKNNLKPQDDNFQVWKKFKPEVVSLNEVIINLLVDGETIASRSIPGSTLIPSTSTLPVLAIRNPTAAQVNRIKNGTFELQVSYRFRDSKVAAIDASFDVNEISESYLSETQRAITENKSSGFKVFGIGYRRSRIKQKLDQSVTQQSTNQQVANTVIVMNDVDDQMIKEFESIFFPSVNKENVIEDHLKAAAEARAAGNLDLATVHENYAKALKNDDSLAEIDAVGAAAALAKKNYAEFVAKGVRAQLSDDIRSNNFSRVISISSNDTRTNNFTSIRKRSVQRAVTDVMEPEASQNYYPRFGLCGGLPLSQPQQVVVTCVTAGSPLALSGVVHGSSILSINGRTFTNITELNDILDDYNPGDTLSVRLLEPTGPITKTIKLTRSAPKPSN